MSHERMHFYLLKHWYNLFQTFTRFLKVGAPWAVAQGLELTDYCSGLISVAVTSATTESHLQSAAWKGVWLVVVVVFCLLVFLFLLIYLYLSVCWWVLLLLLLLFCLHLDIRVPLWGKWGQRTAAGTWRQELKGKPRSDAAHWIAPRACLTCFLIAARITCPVLSLASPLTSVLNQE